MISWQTAAHWPYVEAPFPFYLVFYDRGRPVPGDSQFRQRIRSGPPGFASGPAHCGRKRLRGWPRTFGFSDFSGFPRITREWIGRSSRNFAYLTSKQFCIFPENFKPVPTMTFDLWPYFQGHVKRNLVSVPFQHLKLANFGMFASDMDMDRYWEVTSMVYTDIVTFPRSTEVIRGQ